MRNIITTAQIKIFELVATPPGGGGTGTGSTTATTTATTTGGSGAGKWGGTLGGESFWKTDIGELLSTFLGVIGILVVVFTIVRTIKEIAKGQFASAVKGIVGAMVVATFLFNPTLVESAISAFSGIVEKVISTISDLGS